MTAYRIVSQLGQTISYREPLYIIVDWETSVPREIKATSCTHVKSDCASIT